MKSSTMKTFLYLFAGLGLLMLTACGGSSGSDSSSASGTGTLSIQMTDATHYDYKAVYVTIDEVSVHRGATDTGDTMDMEPDVDNDGDWEVVATPHETINLLDLVNGVMHQLGVKDLEAAHYTQMRLIIGTSPSGGTNILGNDHPYANYVIEADNDEEEMKVPSRKLKLVRGFDIAEGELTELILDFDASRSVVKRGNDKKIHANREKYLLKPVIKVLGTRQYAMIHGTVEDADGPLPGVLVSAQQTTDDPDEAGLVRIEAATTTETGDETMGQYLLIVNPGSYHLVAFAENHDPACESGDTQPGQPWTQDFMLVENMTGATLTGEVTVMDGLEDQPVSISVRQDLPCPGVLTTVEILSEQVANGGSYSFYLPEGDYRVVASSLDQTTQSVDVELDDGETETLDFNLN